MWSLIRMPLGHQSRVFFHMPSFKVTFPSSFINLNICNKHTLDYSRVPTVNEDDLEEQFVRGSGPGGQAVNKTNNCVVLLHKPTGIVIKCHHSRLQEDNRKLARKLLVTKLDNMLNGEMSVEAQEKAIYIKKSNERVRRQRKLAEMKTKWKESESESLT